MLAVSVVNGYGDYDADYVLPQWPEVTEDGQVSNRGWDIKIQELRIEVDDNNEKFIEDVSYFS